MATLLLVKGRERNSQVQSPELMGEELFQKGIAAEKALEVTTALNYYKQAVAHNPDAAGAWLNIGTIYYDQGQYHQAEQFYRRALTTSPHFPLAYYNLGLLLEESGRIPDAIEYYEKALEQDSEYSDARFNLGLLYSRIKEHAQAIKHFRAFLRCGTGRSYLLTAVKEIRKHKASLDAKLNSKVISIAR